MPVVNIGPQNVEGVYKRGTTVTVRLIAGSANTPGYAGGGVVLAQNVVKTVETATASPLEFTLTANADISPANSYYEYTVKPPGMEKAKRGYFQVPDTAGPFDVEDILVDPPSDLESPALTQHRLSVGDHDDVDLTGIANGNTLVWDTDHFEPGAGGGGGGVTDHGALTGLEDDDHVQYALANGSRGNFEASGAVATHSADTTDVHGIVDTADIILEGDARLTDARTPTAHTHDDRYYTEAETDTLLAGKSSTAHTHTESLSVVFAKSGALATGTGTLRFYAPGGFTWTIAEVRASVGTAPTGASLIADIHRSGTTIFTTQTNRPTIAAGSNTDLADAIEVNSLGSGEYLTCDIDQVGSTVAGSDLTVQVLLTRSV